MKSQVLTQFPMIWLSTGGLLIFFCVFCLIGFHAFRKSKKAELDRMAQLALEENENEK